MKRLLVSLVLSILSLSVLASPLRSDNPNYRGAVTIPFAATLQGASAGYVTDVSVANLSGHAVRLRVELYPTSGGHREYLYPYALMPGEMRSGFGVADFMGTIRVVAVHENGADDPSAELSGQARLWVDTHSGVRTSERITGLTDAMIAGRGRLDVVPLEGLGMRPFVLTKARNSRVQAVVTNFDSRTATFEVAPRGYFTEETGHTMTESITVDVPAGESRLIDIPWVDDQNNGKYTPPLEWRQERFVFVLVNKTGGPWSSTVVQTNQVSSDTVLFFDPVTDALSGRR